MPGFEITFWDWVTFATAALAGVAVLVILLWIMGLPDRHRPQAPGGRGGCRHRYI